jgi:hypothetical protein
MRVMMWGAWMFSADVGEAVVNQTRNEFVNDAVVGLATVFARRNELEVSKEC